ncbi:hypothetical protein [Embleya sp. NPDC020886]|uniref:hypothetical protein n=1 Tax=Embleya sp. NPDC020886 TaxID=3363980 RepID=UPI0037A0A348
MGDRERQVRLTSERDADVLPVPPLEPWYADPLSPLRLELVCDAVDCAPDSRHRRRRKEAAIDETSEGNIGFM